MLRSWQCGSDLVDGRFSVARGRAKDKGRLGCGVSRGAYWRNRRLAIRVPTSIRFPVRFKDPAPTCVLTPDRRRVQSVSAADIVDGGVAKGVSEIVQRAVRSQPRRPSFAGSLRGLRGFRCPVGGKNAVKRESYRSIDGEDDVRVGFGPWQSA